MGMMRASCQLKKAHRHPHGRLARAARSRWAAPSAAPVVLPSRVLVRVAAVSSARAGMHGANAAGSSIFAVNFAAVKYGYLVLASMVADTCGYMCACAFPR